MKNGQFSYTSVGEFAVNIKLEQIQNEGLNGTQKLQLGIKLKN